MLDSLTNIVTVLLVLSVSAERLVELVKGLSSKLDTPNTDADLERSRKLRLHILSVVAGCIVVFLSHRFVESAIPELKGTLLGWQGLGLGVLASGGSSLWNSVLTYLLSVKDLKRQESRGALAATANTPAGAATGSLPSSMPGLGAVFVR